MPEFPDALECDLLVAGAGMAGMTAAGVAASRGAGVLVVEKEPTLGGSAAISGGHVWTTPTAEGLARESPGSDPALAALLIDRFAEAVDWIRASGCSITDELTVLGYGRGYRFDVLAYLDRCRSLVEAAGGWVLPGRRLGRLEVTDGRVVGARIAEPDGEQLVRSRWTLLATGGFAASEDLVGRHICQPEQILVRAAPGVTGDGLEAALAAGAATTQPLSPFYGHLVAWPLSSWDEPQFIRLSYFYSHQGLLLDTAGRRFADESHMDHCNAQAVASRPDGRAVLVLDADMTAAAVETPAAQGMNRPDPFVEATADGAHTATCETLEQLAEVLTSWGFDGAAAARTLREYDRAAQQGEVDPPPRSGIPRFHRPPFRAAEVRSGITVTLGGLSVDDGARVRRQDGSAIPGLLAAGADVGGMFDGGYAGGLAAAAVLGLAAADTATTEEE